MRVLTPGVDCVIWNWLCNPYSARKFLPQSEYGKQSFLPCAGLSF